MREFAEGSRKSSWSRKSARFIETQIKEQFYNWPGRKPAAHRRQERRARRPAAAVDRRADAGAAGARDRHAARRASSTGRIDRARRTSRCLEAAERSTPPARPRARPYFCSGCPHDTSTRCPKAAWRWPASAATSWRAGWTATPTRCTPDGRRRRQLGRPGAVHRRQARVPEPRRRHLLPLRLAGDPRGGRRRRQHHLQDPLQRCRRHDRRPAGRRPDQRAADRAQVARRGRAAHRRRHRRPGSARPARLRRPA